MTDVLDVRELVPRYILEENYFDIVEPEVSGLPVNIYIDNFKIMPGVQYGMWFCVSKDKGMNVYSYIDINGNFYHNTKDFFLSKEDLQEIYIFVQEYSDLIIDLYDDNEDFYTSDFKFLLRRKYPFNFIENKEIYLREYKTKELRKLKELGTVKVIDTGLPMLIWLDNGGRYNNTGHYKRIKFQCNTNVNSRDDSNQCSMDLQGNIYNKDKVDYKLSTKHEELLRNFVKNNNYALSVAMENKITQTFFEDYCIKDSEYNEYLATIFEDFTKWRITNPYAEESEFEDYEIMEDIKNQKDIDKLKRLNNKLRNRNKKNNKKKNK